MLLVESLRPLTLDGIIEYNAGRTPLPKDVLRFNIKTPAEIAAEEKFHQLAFKLLDMPRYEGVPILHRTNNLTHTNRVNFYTQAIVRVLENMESWPYFDVDHYKTQFGSTHHDLGEVFGTDVLAIIKQNFTPEQKALFEQQEDEDHIKVCQTYLAPKDEQEVAEYLNLHHEIRSRSTLESQIINVADKGDALCEKLHSAACGDETDDIFEMIENSRSVFSKFAHYKFWPELNSHPLFRFDQIPTQAQIKDLPKITYEATQTLKPRQMINYLKDWPPFYKLWLELSYQHFWKYRNEFIYPGWYPDLKQKLTEDDGSKEIDFSQGVISMTAVDYLFFPEEFVEKYRPHKERHENNDY